MFTRHFYIALMMVVCVSGCKIDPATEAKLEQALEQSLKESSNPSSEPAGGEIYYDVKTRNWRSPDGEICHTCTAAQGFPTPAVQDNEMYYDPEIKKWRQSSMKGEICNTCTPQNGYPNPPQNQQGSSEKVLPEERGRWCKNEVMNQYNTYQADISIVGQRENNTLWRVDSKAKTGVCVFNEKNEFVKIVVDGQSGPFKKTGAIYWNSSENMWIGPDGLVCNSCTPGNGFPVPPKTQDGFFYLPEDRKWYDPDGNECHSCTPGNGFPVPSR